MRIDWGEDNRLRPHHPEIGRAQWHRQNHLRLTGAPIGTSQLAAIDNMRIERVSDNIAISLCPPRIPVTKSNGAVIAAARDTYRTALLLSAVQMIGKCVIGA